MKIEGKILMILIFCLAACQGVRQEREMDLSGQWAFSMDTADVGIEQQWFARRLEEKVHLPGSMKENQKGFEPSLQTRWTGSIYDSSWFFNPHTEPYRQPGDLKFPFWLTPNLYYVGPAWYQKRIIVPASWEGKRIILHLERPHWETIVWINEKKVGTQTSLSVPHEYDITEYLTKRENTLTIRVDNRIKDINVGPDSHSLTDHTQGNWNGIVGDIKLKARPSIFLNDIQVYPDLETRTARVRCLIKNHSETSVDGTLILSASSFNGDNRHVAGTKKHSVKIKPGTNKIEVNYALGEKAQLWSEFNPALYRLEIELKTDVGINDAAQTTFGMRSFRADGRRFTVNGRPVFLRGTLDCAAYPLTGYPPTDKEAWRDIYERAMAYGVNHFRFHSWCPPEAAFEAADELGLYLQIEGPFWTNHGTSVGDGKPVDQYIREECNRILESYGNHPSFVMFAYGNEPAGRNQIAFLNKLVEEWKAKDPRHLYTHASIGRSWPLAPANEFIVRSEARGLPWNRRPNSMFDFGEKIAPYEVPYVAHEMGQYCVFPDFAEIPKYTGVYRPRNFEMFKAELERKNMGDQARDFFMASGKFQTICYKNEIEASLRTPQNGGVQLLGISDFPGQGSAIVGVANVFWEPKDYVTPDEFRRFFSPTVPLARFPKFVFTSDESLSVDLEVAHYGAEPLKSIMPRCWILNAEGDTIASHTLDEQYIDYGHNHLGNLSFSLGFVKQAGKYRLEVEVDQYRNDWEFWVYPKKLPEINHNDILIAHDFNADVVAALNEGKNVLLLAAGKVERGKEVVQYFRPVFWNTSWFQMRPPHTLGIFTNPNHPALADFPTEFHSNLQWWALLHRQQVMDIDHFPPDFRPIVQPIDTWFMNRKLALIFEAKVANGKLVVCSADIENNLDDRPAVRQVRYSLLKYMTSDRFKPTYRVALDQIKRIFTKSEKQRFDFHTSESPDELKPK